MHFELDTITIRPYTTDIGVMENVFFDRIFDFDIDFEPRFIVDVGSNIGLVSIYWAKKYPDAKIISVEPEQSNYEILRINTNPYKNISILKHYYHG